MRMILLSCLALAFPLHAAETARAFPLWDGKETVAAYAAKVNLPPTKSIDLGGGVMLDLMLIPAGQFMMGTQMPKPPSITVEDAENMAILGGILLIGFASMLLVRKLQKKKVSFSLRYLLLMTALCGLLIGGLARRSMVLKEFDRYKAAVKLYQEYPHYEKPAHSVTLTRPFYMGKYTITSAQYKAAMGNYPSPFRGAQLPVHNVSWDDAMEFCKKLNTLLNDNALNAHLPTEAQWEYACRAGTQSLFYSGNLESDLDAVGWFNKNSGGKMHAVGEKKANAFGLYDMHGNILQWCSDWFGPFYSNSATIDPKGPESVAVRFESIPSRVLRGGSWIDSSTYCRSASRSIVYPQDSRHVNFGFRIVLTPLH